MGQVPFPNNVDSHTRARQSMRTGHDSSAPINLCHEGRDPYRISTPFGSQRFELTRSCETPCIRFSPAHSRSGGMFRLSILTNMEVAPCMRMASRRSWV